MVTKNKIYLAGTIYNTYPGNTWKSRLRKYFLKDIDQRFEFIDPDPKEECDLTMVARDKSAINSCDIMVAYIERASVGTSMEIYHAFLRGDIPIIVICPNDFCTGNIWIEAHIHVMVSRVEDAVKYIRAIQF